MRGFHWGFGCILGLVLDFFLFVVFLLGFLLVVIRFFVFVSALLTLPLLSGSVGSGFGVSTVPAYLVGLLGLAPSLARKRNQTERKVSQRASQKPRLNPLKTIFAVIRVVLT
jgi:hypothetical protein